MNQWLNPSHPRTLQAAVFLGYLSAVFGLLFDNWPRAWLGLGLVISIGLAAGAFGSANNRRWGYLLLAVCSILTSLQYVYALSNVALRPVPLLIIFNSAIFPAALIAAIFHRQSREYQRIWFE